MSILLKGKTVRRTVLRGMLQGSAIAVALPFLDCFLNNNGTALASGAALPVRFGSWFWGLGHQPGFGVTGQARGGNDQRKDTLQDLVLMREAAPLERHKQQMNFFSGFNAELDGRPNFVHYGGLMVARTGTAPAATNDIPAPTFDVLIADAVGDGTRFRRLDVAASGGSLSARSVASRNASIDSPGQFYARVFGADFVDPNKAEFKPDPAVMVRRSVLSGVDEHSKRLMATLGAADKERMDAYFTSIRELEQQLSLQLQKPPPNEACIVPAAPLGAEARTTRGGYDLAERGAGQGGQQQDAEEPGTEVEAVIAKHRVMTQLLTIALACNQTKVFTMGFSSPASSLRKAGSADTHHTISHEEPMDPKLGYQPLVSWFNIRSMEALAEFVDAFAAVREGSGTLLDNTLIYANSDTNDAKTHQIDSIPVMMFGKSGGRLKTGNFVPGSGDPITRVGLTAMQAVGVPIQTWGTKSNETSKTVKEILV